MCRPPPLLLPCLPCLQLPLLRPYLPCLQPPLLLACLPSLPVLPLLLRLLLPPPVRRPLCLLPLPVQAHRSSCRRRRQRRRCRLMSLGLVRRASWCWKGWTTPHLVRRRWWCSRRVPLHLRRMPMLRRQLPQVSCPAPSGWHCMHRHACSLAGTALSRCGCLHQRGWMACLRMRMHCWGYRTWLQTCLRTRPLLPW